MGLKNNLRKFYYAMKSAYSSALIGLLNSNKIYVDRVGKGNKVSFNNKTLKNVTIRFSGTNNELIVHSTAKLHDCVLNIKGHDHIVAIGADCRIANSQIDLEDVGCRVEIGNSTTFEGVHIGCVENGSKVTIGQDCMFSHDIAIRTSDSHSIIDMYTRERLNPAKDVLIGDHVWVGANTKILKGARLGDHSIIALGSVVTGNLESNSIFGGIPARKIKSGISWVRPRI